MIEPASPPAPRADEARPTLPLELTCCPLCDADLPEPVAVGEDFVHRSSRDSYLVVRCQRCALVYLNPRPSPGTRAQVYPPSGLDPAAAGAAGRRAMPRDLRAFLRRCRMFAPGGRVLLISEGAAPDVRDVARLAAWDVDVRTPHATAKRHSVQSGLRPYEPSPDPATGPDRRYDLVLLFDALEHWDRPLEEMRELSRVLKLGGGLALRTPNADSSAARTFAGRHWAGYDLPRHRCLFGPGSLRRLAEAAGLTVEWLDVVSGPESWTESAAHFLADWRAPGWLQGPAAAGALPFRAAGAIAESLASARGRGAALHALLRRPA